MTRLAFRLPKLGHTCLAGLFLALALPGIRPAAAASVDCPDAGLLGPALLGSICWDCVFPIRFGGAVIGDGDVPDGAADGAVCVCDDHRGIPHLGLTYGMWEPAGLFEIVRSPGCSPILGGTRIEATGNLLRGSRGGTLYDKGDRAFYHYHMWKFPLLAMLELFTPTECVRDGGVDIDLLYFSELDPTWVYDELAFLANPESAAVASPEAQAACIADAAAATAGHPIDALFWCAGTWGPLDEMYLGERHARVRDERYDQLVDAYVTAVAKLFPNAMLHWEDFGASNARRILDRYAGEHCTFNDDMQGTAAVVLAAAFSAVRAAGTRLRDQRVVIHGAGTAGLGVADILRDQMVREGLSHEEATGRFWALASSGVIADDRLEHLSDCSPARRTAR